VVGGSIVTLGMLQFLEQTHAAGWMKKLNVEAAVLASIVGAVVETAPPLAVVGNIDNVLVPLSSVAVCAAMGAY
jgi:hypothetical protein